MEDAHEKYLEADEYKNKPNLLIKEKSPYLQQHAFNPVNWMAWGEEAFKKAQKENKPIFLSIGYSTCHWCHVMAHESFEDNEVANLLNDIFISIKVDREERPDIDNIYMTVCQMMTGSGGWPLTILMTPDKKPFFAGTYFPKESRFGRMGIKDLILRIKTLWNNNKSEVLDSAEKVTSSLQSLSEESIGDKIDGSLLKNAFKQLIKRFDRKNGGFGNRPKFPTPHNLIFLLRFWNRTGNNEALDMVEKTLQEMRKGGIYDHIGYGFHRYSTDSNWLIPHFEKMLYDQALIAIVYLEAYLATKKIEYANTANEILTYVLRDMTSDEGGFYSAEDADSEGVEGEFYVWSKKEIEEVLEKDDAKLITEVYNLEDSGNYIEEVIKERTGKNIFHQKESISYIASKHNLTKSELEHQLKSIRIKLFEFRDKKIHPHKDDKILTDWNGLMIAALAKGAKILKEPKYLEAAQKAVNFIMNKMLKQDRRLLHRFRDGSADIDAYLDDYSFLIWGLIELYDSSYNADYLKIALELNNDLLKHFWDDNIGGFFFIANDGEKLIARRKEIYDGAVPSGNSIAMLNLLKLSYLTGKSELEEKAEIIGRVFSDKINTRPDAYTQLLIAIIFAVGPSYTLVIAGDKGNEDTNKMLEHINQNYIPNKVLIYRPTENYPPKIDRLASFVKLYEKVDNKTTAYICANKTCKPPTHDLSRIIEYLNSEWKMNNFTD